MTPGLSAIAFALGAQAFAYIIIRALGIRAERAFLVWVAGALLLFGLRDPLTVLLLLGLVTLVAAPAQSGPRAAFFMAVVPALPVYVQADLPFPGINFLAILTFERIAIVGLLLPILFYARPNAPTRIRWVDLSLGAYAFYMAVMVGNAINITSGLRFLADQFVLLVIPYLALSRAVEKREDLETCFKGFVAAAVILAAIALVATIKQWDFYRLLEPPSILSLPDYRGGLLRIAATANTHSLGYCLATAIILLEYLKSRMSIGMMTLMLTRALLLAGVFVTGSRGALAALVVAAGVLAILSLRSRALQVLVSCGALVASIAAATWLYSGDSAELDPYGTFDYRQELIATSLGYIHDHLVFGDLNFLASGYFDKLIQGQGIVDITNLYLQVALNFGLIGFVLFFSVIVWTVLVLTRAALRNTQDNKDCAVILAALCGWLVLIATTSDVGLTLYLGIVLAALGRAAYAHATVADTSAAPVEPLARGRAGPHP